MASATPVHRTADESNRNVVAPRGVSIAPNAVVPREADLKGEISIGSGTVIHPSAKIHAENGPIIIDSGNILEEKVLIRNVFPVGPDGKGRPLYIGSKNHIESYAVVEGNIGNNNTIAAKARVGPDTNVSTGCLVGPMCSVETDETLPPNTVITCGGKLRWVIDYNYVPPNIEEHSEYLQKQLPNYHYVLKPTASS